MMDEPMGSGTRPTKCRSLANTIANIRFRKAGGKNSSPLRTMASDGGNPFGSLLPGYFTKSP